MHEKGGTCEKGRILQLQSVVFALSSPFRSFSAFFRSWSLFVLDERPRGSRYRIATLLLLRSVRRVPAGSRASVASIPREMSDPAAAPIAPPTTMSLRSTRPNTAPSAPQAADAPPAVFRPAP